MANIQTWTRRVFFSDPHEPYADPTAIKVLKDFCKDFRPHEVICLGDLITSDQVSNYSNDCVVDLHDEFKAGEALLEELKVTHFALGNHEARLMRPTIPRNMRKQLSPVVNMHLVERGIKWKPYHKTKGVFRFGKLAALHGHYWNEYVARTTAAAYGCCVFGHTHRMQTHQPKQAFAKNTGFNIGCLCKMDLDYMVERPPEGWAQGFAFGYFKTASTFSLYPARLIGNEFIIEGKTYARR